ncbi:MAG: hypothetical protein LRY40_04715 [Shewanella fodinae]|nr:hypothetical protein [Shewanella fodinae]
MTESDAKAFMQQMGWDAKMGLSMFGIGGGGSAKESWTEQQQQLRQYLASQGVNQGHQWKNDWSKIAKDSKDHTESATNRHSYNEMQSKKDADSYVLRNQMNEAFSETAKESESYQQAQQRVNELRATQGIINSGSGGLSVRFGDTLAGTTGDQVLSRSGMEKILGGAGFTLMEGRFGQDFTKLAGDDKFQYSTQQIGKLLSQNASVDHGNESRITLGLKKMLATWNNESWQASATQSKPKWRTCLCDEQIVTYG